MALNIIIAIILSVVAIYFFVNRKKTSKSTEEFQHVCKKYNYDNQSVEYMVSGCNWKFNLNPNYCLLLV